MFTNYKYLLFLKKQFCKVASIFTAFINAQGRYNDTLKVLTNEKRGGLRVISFDRSPFKLFSRKFSKESVHAGPILHRFF
jgi:hypothetical protein